MKTESGLAPEFEIPDVALSVVHMAVQLGVLLCLLIHHGLERVLLSIHG